MGFPVFVMRTLYATSKRTVHRIVYSLSANFPASSARKTIAQTAARDSVDAPATPGKSRCRALASGPPKPWASKVMDWPASPGGPIKKGRSDKRISPWARSANPPRQRHLDSVHSRGTSQRDARCWSALRHAGTTSACSSRSSTCGRSGWSGRRKANSPCSRLINSSTSVIWRRSLGWPMRCRA